MRIAIAFSLAALLIAAPAPASEVEGVRFEERVEVGGRALELQGAGLLRYRWVIKAYVAALYLPPGTTGAQALEDVPKRLEIEYFWSLAAPDFGKAADELLRRKLPAAELARLRERLDRFHSAYRDVEPGDRYALDYAPGAGTTLRLNGKALANVPGADFAAAYFGIWLGEPPLDASLRQNLLRSP